MRRLNSLDRGDDLEQAYRDLIERFEGAPMLADVIDSAFLSRNDFANEWTELDLPRLEVIWQSRDAVDKNWGKRNALEARDSAARILSEHGKTDEAIAMWQEVAQFSNSEDYDLRMMAAHSMLNLADCFRGVGKPNDAREFLQKVKEALGSSTNSWARRSIAKADDRLRLIAEEETAATPQSPS
jgi:tetratricopeptide (TPR) repeat protein